MRSVTFRVVDARNVPFSATPQIALTIEVDADETGREVQSLLVHSSVRLEAGLRLYEPSERDNLTDLFGSGSVWARAPKSLLWANVTSVVPGFESRATFEVHLPCSPDLAATASKYLSALEAGEVPITVQFSGTVFFSGSAGLEVSHIPRDREASFRFPAALFRRAADEHFPNAVVFGLRRDVFERLEGYRKAHGLLEPADAIEHLLRSPLPRGTA
jgi:hypothetical protein